MGRGKAEKPNILAMRVHPRRRHQLQLIAKVLPGKHSMTSILEMGLDVLMATTPELKHVPDTWAEEPSARFVKTASLFAAALDHDEARLWEAIKSRPELWQPAPQTFAESRESFLAQDPGRQVGAPRLVSQSADGTPIFLQINYSALASVWDLLTAHFLNGQGWDERAFQQLVKKHAAKKTKR